MLEYLLDTTTTQGKMVDWQACMELPVGPKSTSAVLKPAMNFSIKGLAVCNRMSWLELSDPWIRSIDQTPSLPIRTSSTNSHPHEDPHTHESTFCVKSKAALRTFQLKLGFLKPTNLAEHLWRRRGKKWGQIEVQWFFCSMRGRVPHLLEALGVEGEPAPEFQLLDGTMQH